MDDQHIIRLFNAAGAAQQAGRIDEAKRLLEQLLADVPDQPQALNALGIMAMTSGDAAEATALFTRAVARDPGAAPLWLNLAKAQRMAGDDAGEAASLRRVLEIDRLDFMASVRLAELHERRGEDALAAKHWTSVIALAAGLPQRTPELDALIARAQGFVAQQGARFAEAIDAALAPSRAEYDGDVRRRFEACVDHALGRRAIYRNQCEGIHYPFLPADEFFERRHFPWMTALEAHTPAIRAEIEAYLEANGAGFVPYVEQEPGTPANKWTRLVGSFDWSALFLWKYGVRNEALCAAFPATVAALDGVPLLDAERRGPTAFFSLLKPGTRLPPHSGVTNTRAIVHLPLIVPEKCGFRVGGEIREWREGSAFAFDDTIEHEAWNDSAEPRIVLILDVWNPHLTAEERELLCRFYRASDASGFNPDQLSG